MLGRGFHVDHKQPVLVKMIQVCNVPEDLHRALKIRAAAEARRFPHSCWTSFDGSQSRRRWMRF